LNFKEILFDASSQKMGGKKAALKKEALPSPMGIRVVPRIADELKVIMLCSPSETGSDEVLLNIAIWEKYRKETIV
jgi:hypothetical protein